MKQPQFVIALTTLILAVSCGTPSTDFASVNDGHFVNTSSPYYIGANFWYGAILGGGNSERLTAELDNLHSLGINNLRVLVGGDGPDGVPTRIEPTLQKAPGEYNEDIFRGLDRLLVEMGKRNMQAVLYINNSWEWSGGYGMYLEWAGEGKAPIPAEIGYQAYMETVGKFVTNEKAKALFADHVRTVVSRTNSITGKQYSEDPAIFSWQIGNEPRCFSSDPAVQQAFADWMWSTAALIKSIDGNHMVSSGSEGKWGCEVSLDLFEKIHSCPDIDYMNIHIWPYNWGWAKPETLAEDLPNVIAETDAYIDEHIAIAKKYGKPVVLEEFGFPRDGFRFSKDVPVTVRDAYYAHVFDRIVRSKEEGGLFAGVNFWAWGGYASQNPDHEFWQRGDDLCGDPAQEAQGLNSVYASDSSTIGIIRDAVTRLE